MYNCILVLKRMSEISDCLGNTLSRQLGSMTMTMSIKTIDWGCFIPR